MLGLVLYQFVYSFQYATNLTSLNTQLLVDLNQLSYKWTEPALSRPI